MIVEFDGIQHYKEPDKILSDSANTEFYKSLGYKVVRIPYFIQLSKKAIKDFFGVETHEEFFDETIPSLGIKEHNTPAYLCASGVKRMAEEFKRFPEQYETNIQYLASANNEFLTGVSLLVEEYNKIRSK